MPNNLYKETRSVFVQVGVQKLTGGHSTGSDQKEPFAILTQSILARRDISGSAKVILAAMLIESKGTGIVAMSTGAIAISAGCSRGTAVAGCAALLKAPLIEKYGEQVNQIQPYRILHVRLAYSGIKPVPTTIAAVFCPQCHRRVRSLPKLGPCRDCRWNAKVDRRIDAKLRKA